MTHADFLAQLAHEYPKTARDYDVRSLVIPTLISPTALQLPLEWRDEAQRLVSVFFNGIRQNEHASRLVPPRFRSEELRLQNPALPPARNASVLMSYDFHVEFPRASGSPASTPGSPASASIEDLRQGRLRLIEINTNASMSLLIDLMNGERGLEPKEDFSQPQTLRCFGRRAKELLMDDFAEELLTARGQPLTEISQTLRGARVVIVDDEPRSQKLFVEFLLYKENFERRGAECVIVDRRDLEMRAGKLWVKAGAAGASPESTSGLHPARPFGPDSARPFGPDSARPFGPDSARPFGPIDLVYNRATDFYFEEPASAALREAMMTAATVITPNPYDYRMLADKDRLVEWSRDGALEATYGLSTADADRVRAAVLRTRETKAIEADQLWKERKGLMFKPRRAYGGKGVFRGSSISRGAFDGVLANDALAQDFVPAPTTKIDGVEFKYDLRFFAYRDYVHVACARLYQGQMTNATTPGGGVTSIHWI